MTVRCKTAKHTPRDLASSDTDQSILLYRTALVDNDRIDTSEIFDLIQWQPLILALIKILRGLS